MTQRIISYQQEKRIYILYKNNEYQQTKFLMPHLSAQQILAISSLGQNNLSPNFAAFYGIQYFKLITII